MSLFNQTELKWYDKMGKQRPTHSPHGMPDDLRGNMRKLQPNTWHLEGNNLIGMTELGKLVQRIPPDYILEGTDEKGLPKFRKVDIV